MANGVWRARPGGTWALVPVKTLAAGKSRLTPALSDGERAELVCRLLRRTLVRLREAPAIDGVLVVTRDPALTALAEAEGAEAVAEPGQVGLNGALRFGYRFLRRRQLARLVVLPADLPFFMAADIEALLAPARVAMSAALQFVLCADEARFGTNALCLAGMLPDDMPFQFGPNSFRAHLEAARMLAATIHVLHLPGIAFDLDTVTDLARYRAQLAGDRVP